MQLNQVVALVKGKKSRAAKLLTEVHHRVFHKDKVTGISRTYQPIADDGEMLPAENRRVQVHVEDQLIILKSILSDFIDVVVTQDMGNTKATGDIQIGDDPLLTGIPVTVLMFIEKQLVDMRTLIEKLPVLPTDRVWSMDEAKNCWVTQAEKTIKTQKKAEVIVKYDATDKHPAQTDLISVDKTVGHWSTIHISGAIPESRRDEMLTRINLLSDAVKAAREQANSREVTYNLMVGETLLGYILK